MGHFQDDQEREHHARRYQDTALQKAEIEVAARLREEARDQLLLAIAEATLLLLGSVEPQSLRMKLRGAILDGRDKLTASKKE